MENLRELRKTAGFSLRDVEMKTGESRANISRWENYKRRITGPGAEKLAEFYEVSSLRLKNIQTLRFSLSEYEQINESDIPPEEAIEKLWTAEKVLNKHWPADSTVRYPHKDLSEEIEFWRQKLLWVIQDAKEALREGNKLLPMTEDILEGSFDLFEHLGEFEKEKNQTNDYFYLDRATAELIDQVKKFRFVDRNRPTFRERYSYGLYIIRESIPEVIEDIETHQWDELRREEVIIAAEKDNRNLEELMGTDSKNQPDQEADTA